MLKQAQSIAPPSSLSFMQKKEVVGSKVNSSKSNIPINNSKDHVNSARCYDIPRTNSRPIIEAHKMTKGNDSSMSLSNITNLIDTDSSNWVAQFEEQFYQVRYTFTFYILYRGKWIPVQEHINGKLQCNIYRQVIQCLPQVSDTYRICLTVSNDKRVTQSINSADYKTINFYWQRSIELCKKRDSIKDLVKQWQIIKCEKNVLVYELMNISILDQIVPNNTELVAFDWVFGDVQINKFLKKTNKCILLERDNQPDYIQHNYQSSVDFFESILSSNQLHVFL